jgi:hypothetical protein
MGRIAKRGLLLVLLWAGYGHARCGSSLAALPKLKEFSVSQMNLLEKRLARVNPSVKAALVAEGDGLRVASIEDLLAVVRGTEETLRQNQLRCKNQIITPSKSQDDLDLLAASDLDSEPGEAFVITIALSTGEKVKSEIRKGVAEAVSPALVLVAIEEVLDRKVALLKNRAKTVKSAEVEFSHVHTIPDLYLPQRGAMLTSELSAADIALGKMMSKIFADVPVVVKAVTQSDYNYQLVFRNGEISQ